MLTIIWLESLQKELAY